MTVEKLDVSEINKHEGYVSATKAGNTVWNARSTQKIYREEDKVEVLEKKVNAMQDSLDKILDKLTGA
jgi:Zn-finger protein